MVARCLQEFRYHVQKQEKDHLLLVSLGVRFRCTPTPFSGPTWPEYVICPYLHQSLARRWDHHGRRHLGSASPEHIPSRGGGNWTSLQLCEEGVGGMGIGQTPGPLCHLVGAWKPVSEGAWHT